MEPHWLQATSIQHEAGGQERRIRFSWSVHKEFYTYLCHDYATLQKKKTVESNGDYLRSHMKISAIADTLGLPNTHIFVCSTLNYHLLLCWLD